MNPKTLIPDGEIEYSKLSIVDPLGRVFFWNEKVYRAIPASEREVVEQMFACGLVQRLVDEHLIPSTTVSRFYTASSDYVVEHEKVQFLTYPYEWTPGMLRDAALLVLKLNDVVQEFGFQLKDCHPFNITFQGSQPVYLDLGSFVRKSNSGNDWYREFITSYVAPLYYAKLGLVRLQRAVLQFQVVEADRSIEYCLIRYPWLSLFPSSIVRKLLDVYYRILSLGPLSQHVPKMLQFFNSFFLRPAAGQARTLSIKRMRVGLARYRVSHERTMWSSYHSQFLDHDEFTATPRLSRVSEIVSRYGWKTVVDLGGNQGALLFNLLKLGTVKSAVCIDTDPSALEGLNSVNRKKRAAITAVLQNPFAPISSLEAGEGLASRMRSEVCIAMALTHHLLLSQKLDIEYVFSVIQSYSKDCVMIEFMPLGLWTPQSSVSVPSWYDIDWFRRMFEKWFDLLLEEKLEINRVLFVGRCRRVSNV